jgi:aminocarboxymuconate-semialdehyde decarboxylase
MESPGDSVTYVVDLHAHYVAEALVRDIRRHGSSFGVWLEQTPDGRERAVVGGRPASMPFSQPLLGVEQHLAAMDQAGIDLQAVSTWMDIIGYHLDAEDGVHFARLQNDTIAELVEAHPKRFAGVGTVPLQAPRQAVAELARTVKQLGFRAVQVGTHVNGKNLDAPELAPFWAQAQELDLLVLVHPHNPAGANRMERYFLSNLVGNPSDTTLAAASLIFGGILERLPRLKVLLAHGGGFLPYQLGRFDRGYAVREDLHGRIPRPPSAYWSRFLCDTIVHEPRALRFLLDIAGPGRVVLGTDYPFFIGDDDPVGSVDRAQRLSAADRRAVLGGNACAALGLVDHGVLGPRPPLS